MVGVDDARHDSHERTAFGTAGVTDPGRTSNPLDLVLNSFIPTYQQVSGLSQLPYSNYILSGNGRDISSRD
jgi:hypothetical protein